MGLLGLLRHLGELDELVPPAVELNLDVLDDIGPALIHEVLEPSLGSEPVGHGLLLDLSVRDPLGLGGEMILAVLDLEQRPDTGLDSQLGDGDGVAGSEPPTPGTGGYGVDEGRTSIPWGRERWR